MSICTYIHAYIHASWILELLCWILFVFFHWMFECSVSVAIVVIQHQVIQPQCPYWSLPRPTRPSEKKNAAVPQPDSDPAGGAGAKKRPASAESVKSNKKRTATGAVMKRPGAEDCTAVSTRKDRNKWGYLLRHKDSLDTRVLQMLAGANQRETAALVNNVVRRNRNDEWEFHMNNPVIIDRIKIFNQKYQDYFDQGQPYDVAVTQWGGLQKLNKALQDGEAKKVEKDGNTFIAWKGFKVGQTGGVEQTTEVRAGAEISGQQAIEFSELAKKFALGFQLKQSERQVMVEWYTIHV